MKQHADVILRTVILPKRCAAKDLAIQEGSRRDPSAGFAYLRMTLGVVGFDAVVQLAVV